MADFGAIGVQSTSFPANTGTPATPETRSVFVAHIGSGSSLPGSVRLLGGVGGALQTESGSLVIQGIVRENSVPVARQVYAMRRSDGLLVGAATSSAVDGTFTIFTNEATDVVVVALDDKNTAPAFNALVYDTVLAQ